MKSWYKFAALALVAAGLAIGGAISTYRAAQASPDRIFQRVSERLSCRCGCNQPLSACNHHPCESADSMRAQIRASIAAGKDEEAIVQEFVKQMGVVVLAAPPAQGFTLTAWIMPVAAVLLGLFVVYRVVRSWQRGGRRPSPSEQAAPSTAPSQQDASLQRYVTAIDEELEREP